MTGERRYVHDARELGKALRWERVTYDVPPEANPYNTGIRPPCGLGLCGYVGLKKRDDGKYENAILWNARREPGMIPLVVRSAETGEPLRLIRVTHVGIQGYPIAVGERVLVAMNEQHARAFAREWLDRTREFPEELAKLQAQFGSEAEALDHIADDRLRSGCSEVVTVTRGMLDELAELGATICDVVDGQKVLPDEVEIAIVSRDEPDDDEPDDDEPGHAYTVRSDGETFDPENEDEFILQMVRASYGSASAGVVEVGFVSRTGEELTRAQWSRLRQQAEQVVLDETRIQSRDEPSVAALVRSVWVGLHMRHRKLGEKRIYAVTQRCVVTSDPRGSSPWETLAAASTRRKTKEQHDLITRAIEVSERDSLEEAAREIMARARATVASRTQVEVHVVQTAEEALELFRSVAAIDPRKPKGQA